MHIPPRGLAWVESPKYYEKRKIVKTGGQSAMCADRSLFRASEVEFAEKLRKGLRAAPTNVALLTTRDDDGCYFGLAVTSAVPFSTKKPSMIVAISHSTSSYPVIKASEIFCINQITSGDMGILDRFTRSDQRSSRFVSGIWRAGLWGLPFLETTTTSFFCSIKGAHDYGDHTVFVARIMGLRLGRAGNE
jgi:flavin reductase (DIM6/NTAB) family NADH-FMN oxidoreductase RutF